MKLGQLHGVIDRRLLVNFKADPHVVTRLLPKQFTPQIVDGQAMVGICLIRFSALRPRGVPAVLGFSSENAAHRIAVEWQTSEGPKTGVYVHRRDTSLWLNTLIGGRLFPGVHYRAKFEVRENGDDYFVSFKSYHDETKVIVRGRPTQSLPADSIFKSVAASSDFFKGGAIGFSPGRKKDQLQGLQLITDNWKVDAFAVNDVQSTYFSDATKFPKGSVVFDHALIMRNLTHSWRVADMF